MRKKQVPVEFIYCLGIALIFLLICTKSSPLYPFNDWNDSNAFFTMGKGMMNGKVLYRDLFEQKGPLLYFIHGLAYLISPRSFLGVFVFETLSFAVFLFFAHKIINLYLNRNYSFFILPVASYIILITQSFHFGDSAEEFGLPFAMMSMYLILKYFRGIYPNPMPAKWLLASGAAAGCVAMIKYTFIGFWFGWMLVLAIAYLINKRFLEVIKASGLFLAGIAAAVLPWLIYFIVNAALDDFIHCYFTVNFRAYTGQTDLAGRWNFIVYMFKLHFKIDKAVLIAGAVGIAAPFMRKDWSKSFIGRFTVIFCAAFLGVTVYGGAHGYTYYFFIFSVFVVFGFITVFGLIQPLLAKVKFKPIYLLIIPVVALSLYGAYKGSSNVHMMKYGKEELTQYRFAKIINRGKGATLLNYGFLDDGFYTVAGIVPNVRFFMKQNLDYYRFPENMDEQNRYIKEKLVDFVVFRTYNNDQEPWDVPYLLENYELVAEERYKADWFRFYYLFKAKP
ncbi:MAG TPA: hypothetical protein PLZ84_05060 [Clostridia bacterium]|nr:hypothetical protein [Clostridia bacterium]